MHCLSGLNIRFSCLSGRSMKEEVYLSAPRSQLTRHSIRVNDAGLIIRDVATGRYVKDTVIPVITRSRDDDRRWDNFISRSGSLANRL